MPGTKHSQWVIPVKGQVPEEMGTLVPISQLVRRGLRPKPRVRYLQLFSYSFSCIKGGFTRQAGQSCVLTRGSVSGTCPQEFRNRWRGRPRRRLTSF